MENVWDLLFQLMKHGTNILHVAFTFLFSVESKDTQAKILEQYSKQRKWVFT